MNSAARGRRVLGITVAGLAFCVAAARVPAAEQVRELLGTDAFYQIRAVSDPQVSPDGRWVAYVVTRNDRQADEARSIVYMASWDGVQQVALSIAAKSASLPRWSPDGRYLAFIATPVGSDKSQVMLLDRRGGDARPLSAVDGEVAGYSWSPNGTQLVVSLESPGEAAHRPRVIDTLSFKRDADGYIANGRTRHLYLIDVTAERATALTSGPSGSEDLPVWSPDGRRIAFVHNGELGWSADGREDIEVMDAEPGASPHSLARPFAPNAQRLAWSPDGTELAFLQGAEPKFNAYMQDQLVLIAAAGGTPRVLTAGLDRAVTSYAFDGPGALQLTVEDDRTGYPARLELASGSVTRAAPAGAFVATSISAAAGHTALLRADDAQPAEVYALENGALRKLTSYNDAWLGQLRLGAVEDVEFRSSDGTPVHGILVKPPDYVAGRRYPLVLWIHGGPNGQDEHALAIDAYQFEHQLFAARGYLVLRVNYRGSAGRGAAFARSIAADWGHHEVADLLAGVDAMVARGLADPARLAVGGWSYGGILTDYTIATDRRFKAAISGAGSANQLSMYGVDQYVLQYNNEIGPPWRDPALWLKLSYPFFHADRIHTPTLFLGGERDFNVPVSGGEQMYQALRTLGVAARLVVYPDEHHVFSRPSFAVDLAERMTHWLAQYVPASP